MEHDTMLEMEHNGAGDPGVEGAVGDRNGGVAGRAAPGGLWPDPELVERATRRRFTAEYKLAVLREADGCTQPGEVGALLRREGLYSSHLATWRKQRDAGSIKALSRPRGRKPADGRDAQIAALERRAERAEAELRKARKVIEVQGNVSALLGEPLEPRGATEPGSTGR
jgi:transposase